MAASANRGLIGLFKKAWHEIPEIVGSSAFGIVGLGLCVAANVYYYQNDGDNRKYKPNYTVYRHDDPRVATLRTEYEVTSQS